MADYDWSRFQIVFYYAASVETVYRAWSTAAGLESFLLVNATFSDAKGGGIRDRLSVAAAGDKYRWFWAHGFELEGTVLVAANNAEFSFTFGAMRVDIRLSPIRGQTELVLEQTAIDTTDAGRVSGHLNCRSCWIFFLANLLSVLDHHVDLRNQAPDLASSMEVGFTPLSRKSGSSV